MGERVRQGWLRDLIRVRRGGSLLLHDSIRLDGEVDAVLGRPAVGGGAKVVATMIYVASDADAKLAPVREALGAIEAGASVWNGMLVARMLGAESSSVRKAVIAALDVLREARPLPRVWLC
jgi:urease accessory protein